MNSSSQRYKHPWYFRIYYILIVHFHNTLLERYCTFLMTHHHNEGLISVLAGRFVAVALLSLEKTFVAAALLSLQKTFVAAALLSLQKTFVAAASLSHR
jgi:hypothetical protein